MEIAFLCYQYVTENIHLILKTEKKYDISESQNNERPKREPQRAVQMAGYRSPHEGTPWPVTSFSLPVTTSPKEPKPKRGNTEVRIAEKAKYGWTGTNAESQQNTTN